MSSIRALSSIIIEAESKKTPEEQAAVLQDNDSNQLRSLLEYGFHPAVEWKVPAGSPPYRPLALQDAHNAEGNLYREIRKFDYFVNTDVGNKVKAVKREQLFIDMLESIEAADALMVLRLKNKKLKIKKEACKLAFGAFAKDW